MFKTSCLAAVTGIVLFAVSAAVPGNAFAVTTDYATEDASPSDPASVNSEQRRYAQKKRGGGGRKSGAKRRPKGSASNRGARPSNRPGAGTKPGNRPGTNPGNRPGTKPGNRPGRDVNINRNVNVTVKHRGYGWRGARWGAVIFGVTLGTAIIVAANTPPYPPDPSLCWTWNNAALTSGYWYYCDGL
jgi:hypothetical protein